MKSNIVHGSPVPEVVLYDYLPRRVTYMATCTLSSYATVVKLMISCNKRLSALLGTLCICLVFADCTGHVSF